MYKAAYMFYFAQNVAAKHINEIQKMPFRWWCLVEMWKFTYNTSVEGGLYSKTLKEVLKNCNLLQIYTMSDFRGGV